MHPEDSFGVRVGMFFLVMGGGVFILFVASDLANKADFDFLFLAMILIAIGWSLWRKKPPPPSSERFSYVRKLRDESKRKREERIKAKEEAKKR
jgi:hypothetical protein